MAISARQRHALLSLDRHHGALWSIRQVAYLLNRVCGGILTNAAVGLRTLSVWIVRDVLAALAWAAFAHIGEAVGAAVLF